MGTGSIKITALQQYEMENQKRKCICKIKIDDSKKDYYGFLCSIPNFSKSNNKILITNTSTIIKKDFEILLNKNFKDSKQITNSEYIPRVYYEDKKSNILVIEIKDIDFLDDNNFLEFDSNIFKSEPNRYYKSKDIYFLPFNMKNKIFPRGKINSIIEDFKIEHDNSDLGNESFLFPILLFNNYKVIGFNKETKKGVFLKPIIEKYIDSLKLSIVEIEDEKRQKIKEKKEKKEKEKKENEEKEKKENEEREKKEKEEREKREKEEKEKKEKIINNNIINIKLKIESNEVNKEIYFFGKFDEPQKKKGFLEFFELNKNLIKIFINNDEKNTSTNFKPTNPGNYKIKIEIKKHITDCGYMFYGCSNIMEIDLENTYLSDVKNMNDMFNYCLNLRRVKLPNNIQNVTDLRYMFNYCKNLKVIEQLSKISTKNVTNMAGMFQHCENIERINLEKFNTNNVVQLGCMFNNCYKLGKLEAKFNTEKVIFMPWMFYGCKTIKKIDISSFKIDNIKNMIDIFEGCNQLEKIIVNKNYLNIFKQNYPKYSDKFSS